MISTQIYMVTRCLGLLFSLFCISTLAQGQQSESPVPCIEGDEITLVAGEYADGCFIDQITDADIFTFDGAISDVFRLSVSETTTSAIELLLEVYAPSGALVLSTAPGGNIVNDLTCDETGTYRVIISENGRDETGGYVFQLEQLYPFPPAPGIEQDIPLPDALSPRSDADFYAFAGQMNDVVRLIVSETNTSAVELLLEVWAPDATRIVNTAPGGNIVVDITLPESGTYLVAVSENGRDETGGYQLELQCIVGTCTVPSHPVCDMQMSQPAYIDGEVVSAQVLRVANVGTESIAIDFKSWLEDPNGLTGAKFIRNSITLTPGFDNDFGPISLFTVQPGQPRGTWEFSCRIVDAVTGRQLTIDRNSFDLQ